MSDITNPSNQSAENIAFVLGGFVGFLASMFFWVILFFVIMLVFSGLGNNDAFTFPLLAAAPILAMVGAVYFIVTQKPKGFILGLLIGAGFGLLLQGLCAFGIFVN